MTTDELKRRIEKNIVETRFTPFDKIFDGHKMALDGDAELAFGKGDVFEYNGDFDFIFFAQFHVSRSSRSRFDRYGARTGKKIEKGFAFEIAEYCEHRFAHFVHGRPDNAFGTFDLPAF